jgi:excisionase family DNA binding protein
MLAVPEAAEYLRVSEIAVYRWVEKGQLRAGRAGRLLRFRKEDLDAFMGLEIEPSPKEPQQA